MAETEASVSSGKKKKVGVGHPSGLAVAVRAQICMSVLVALGQVGRAGDRGELWRIRFRFAGWQALNYAVVAWFHKVGYRVAFSSI
jgi:hypothetical protein